jgi:hypothetical protein
VRKLGASGTVRSWDSKIMGKDKGGIRDATCIRCFKSRRHISVGRLAKDRVISSRSSSKGSRIIIRGSHRVRVLVIGVVVGCSKVSIGKGIIDKFSIGRVSKGKGSIGRVSSGRRGGGVVVGEGEGQLGDEKMKTAVDT